MPHIHEKIVRTASVLIVNNHRVLLLLRDNKEGLSNPNTWCLIGGFLDPEENEEEGARREAKEEASAQLEKLDYLGTHEYASGRTSATYLSVISDAQAEQLRLGNEGQEIRFFTFDELTSIPLSGSIKRYYTQYHDQLRTILQTEQPILII